MAERRTAHQWNDCMLNQILTCSLTLYLTFFFLFVICDFWLWFCAGKDLYLTLISFGIFWKNKNPGVCFPNNFWLQYGTFKKIPTKPPNVIFLLEKPETWSIYMYMKSLQPVPSHHHVWSCFHNVKQNDSRYMTETSEWSKPEGDCWTQFDSKNDVII